MSTFTFDYSRVLQSAVDADYCDNYDSLRFGPEPAGFSSLKARITGIIESFGIVPSGAKALALRQGKGMIAAGLDFVEPHLTQLEWLYSRLSDDISREWLVKLTAYRALGYRKIKLPTNTPKFWEVREAGLSIPHGDEEIDPDFFGWKLHKRSLERFGYPIDIFTAPGANYTTFVLQQYRCETDEGPIECSEGDIAIDAGACYGDTALYFAHKAGPTGRVASFEFLPENLEILRRNLALNGKLASRVGLYAHPLWSESGKSLFVSGTGPGTKVSPESDDPDALKVETMKIDDLVSSGDCSRIDFIKMDIEGAELEALKGSEAVLRQFKPKLAITVYHGFEDFWTIPQFLDGLGLGYRFYMRHFTIHAEETVLFARADEGVKG